MARFIVRRLASMVLVLFAVSVLTFLIFNVIPNGDPAVRMAGKQPTEEQIQAIREEWGFDQSIFVQYTTTMEKLFTGDMVSYFTQLDVVDEIIKGIPRTLSLAVGAAIIWMAFGVGLGLVRAPRLGIAGDDVVTPTGMDVVVAGHTAVFGRVVGIGLGVVVLAHRHAIARDIQPVERS